MKVYLAIKWTAESWKECHFWTFTFPDAKDWTQISGSWREIHRRLDSWPMKWPWCGIRVYELHPGGHGVHIHCLCPYRYDLQQILHLLKFAPGEPVCGHIHVKQIKGPRDTIARYMAEYLVKWRFVNKAPKGTRLWATFGLTKDEKTRVCDIQTEGPHKRTWHWIESLPQGWGPLMAEFDIDHRPKQYHKLLCTRQLFALPNPTGFLATIYPNCPVDHLAWGDQVASYADLATVEVS